MSTKVDARRQKAAKEEAARIRALYETPPCSRYPGRIEAYFCVAVIIAVLVCIGLEVAP